MKVRGGSWFEGEERGVSLFEHLLLLWCLLLSSSLSVSVSDEEEDEDEKFLLFDLQKKTKSKEQERKRTWNPDGLRGENKHQHNTNNTQRRRRREAHRDGTKDDGPRGSVGEQEGLQVDDGGDGDNFGLRGQERNHQPPQSRRLLPSWLTAHLLDQTPTTRKRRVHTTPQPTARQDAAKGRTHFF